MIKKWDVKDPEKKKLCQQAILSLVDDLQGRDPGLIFADNLLQSVSEIVGPIFYNQALDDTKKLIRTKLDDIEVDIDILSQA